MEKQYHDYMVRALAAKEQIRAFALTSKDLVEYARSLHHSSPVSTAALGRLLSAGLMMGDMMKSEDDLVTLQLMGDGPLKHVLVTADYTGKVKGYVSNPNVYLPNKENGHLDIASGIGKGTLTVIRDYHMKEPYSSTIDLVSGEIAEDLTYYFAQSEQTPSSVGLGVLVNPDETVECAGGFIVQLMPFASEEVIDQLQRNIDEFTSVTDVLKQGKTPEELLEIILKGFDIQFTGKKDVYFSCNCSQERGKQVISTLGSAEIRKMVEEGKDIEAECVFCGKKYKYTPEELEEILKELNENAAD